jgi:hypothetical protein
MATGTGVDIITGATVAGGAGVGEAVTDMPWAAASLAAKKQDRMNTFLNTNKMSPTVPGGQRPFKF